MIAGLAVRAGAEILAAAIQEVLMLMADHHHKIIIRVPAVAIPRRVRQAHRRLARDLREVLMLMEAMRVLRAAVMARKINNLIRRLARLTAAVSK